MNENDEITGPADDKTETAEARPEQNPAPSSPDVAATPPKQPTGQMAPPGYGPPPGYWWGGQMVATPPQAPAETSGAGQGGGRLRGILRNATVAWVAVAALLLAVIGLSVALGTQSSSSAVGTTAPFGGGGLGRRAAAPGAFGGGFGALGVAGTVASVGSGSFTVNARSGQTVTVNEQSSTTYYTGTTSASSSAVVTGARVIVQGTRSGDTVTATRVEVLSTA